MWNSLVGKKRSSVLWVVSGPSGSGKTTLCSKLLEKGLGIVRSISCTTRSVRKGEKNHRDYIFISKETFLEKIKNGDFLEWKSVFGNLYGTPKSPILKALKNNKDVLLSIDVKGAMEVKKQFPRRSVFIFVLPPNEKELAKRSQKRARESKAEIRRRLVFVKSELSFAKKYDYILVNDDFSKALKNLKSIIIAKGLENDLHTARKTY
jgi:guanylate kinase